MSAARASLTAYVGLQAPAGTRVTGEDAITSLSNPLAAGSQVRDGVRDQAGDQGQEELGPDERWDYAAIEAGWLAECRYFLAASESPATGKAARYGPRRPERQGRRRSLAADAGQAPA